jgi:hypothetical protein
MLIYVFRLRKDLYYLQFFKKIPICLLDLLGRIKPHSIPECHEYCKILRHITHELATYDNIH